VIRIEELVAVLDINVEKLAQRPIERVRFQSLKVIVPIYAVKTGTLSGNTS
jgi:hypothetical protein